MNISAYRHVFSRFEWKYRYKEMKWNENRKIKKKLCNCIKWNKKKNTENNIKYDESNKN